MAAHRIITGAVICFWLLMTAQLIRLEVNPGHSDLMTVPPAHVFKLMFTHGQTSELDVLESGAPVGNVALNPKLDADSDKRTMDFSGNLYHLPGAMKKQRITWEGTMEMDRTYKMSNLQLTLNLLPLNLHEVAYHVHLNLDPVAKKVEYEVKEGDQLVKKSSFSADAAGVGAVLRDEFDIDPSFLQNMHSNIAVPTLAAKQTEIKIHHETTAAYLLTARQGEMVLAEIYVSQLGQILSAKTIFGYNFSAPDMLP